ncbi:MAG TPA: hypothetical protein PLL09_08460 [Flavobacterium sp.]|uniref:hypothetical protein n=2 Tax=unclassified Flavobacterium TaxID=196869 RepID=UPI002CA81429|nr:hypothetical protein [Flavobacterium sp.]HRE77843.1 hypothetical protein [Flavobacterium sp.]
MLLENIRQKFNQHPLFVKSLLVFSFFCSFLINAPFLNSILEFKPAISNFSNHIISNAALHNFDISSRVRLYYFVFFSLVLITVFFFSVFFYFVNKRFVNPTLDKRILKKIEQISIVGIASVLTSLFFVELDLAELFIVFLGFYFFFFSKETANNTFNNGLWTLITSIPFAYLLYRIIKSNGIFKILPETILIKNIPLPVSADLLVFFSVFFIISAILHFILVKKFKSNNYNSQEEVQSYKRFYLATIPLSVIIIAFSISLEIFNIINLKTNYVFNKPKELFAVIAILGIIISMLYYRFLNKRKHSKLILFDPIEKYHFPLLIISLAFMISQPWRMFGPENEFFEFANHGISVDHFFRYGSIPIIETFDAHMLSNQLFAYVFGLLNGYEPWSPFLYSSYIFIFIYLLVYFLLKRILGGFYAFILLLCFPMLSVVISSFIFSGIIALQLFSLFNNKANKRFYWFWGSIIFLCMYRLDLGFASAMAGIVSYFLIHFLAQKSYQLKSFLKTGAISIAATVLLFVVLCLFKGINPISRLLELLTTAMSNQNWAYEDLGNTTHVLFRLTYYILPVLTLFLLANTILKRIIVKSYFHKIIENKSQLAALIFFVFFSLVFYFNIPRGIVRHNFLFNNVVIITSTIPLALICYIYIFKRKNNLLYFLSTLIISYFIINLTTLLFQNKSRSYFKEAFASAPFNEKFQPSYAFNSTRISETFSLAEVKYFKEILDKLLHKDETYFDFSSTNYYHALVGRKNPLYVNQTPLLLNGDRSQDFALEQLKKAKIPIILMPNKENIWHQIDGIPVEYKYYKISEYINENYSPFLKLKDFTIYVENQKIQTYKNKLNISSNQSFAINDFSQKNIEQIQKNDIVVETNETNHLVLTKNGNDAFIFGLYKSNQSKDSVYQNNPKTIKVKIEALSIGSVQLYYWLSGEEYFSEENSKTFQIPSLGNYEFEVNTPTSIEDVRIDVDASKIILNQLTIQNRETELITNSETLNYNLGEIPMVWGELADQKLFKSVAKFNDVLNQNNVILQLDPNTPKNKPYYLFVEMESDTIQAATVSIFDDKNNKKLEYLFRSNQGKHSYAIRLSSNIHWWNEKISKISMTTEKPLKISKFALISEDGKSTFSLKDTDFYLSNITDENWSGGVGIPFNVVLMDNSQRTLSKLKTHKKIEMSSGEVINITKYWNTGNFIHVEIAEPLETYRSKIAYPNNFKFIK